MCVLMDAMEKRCLMHPFIQSSKREEIDGRTDGQTDSG